MMRKIKYALFYVLGMIYMLMITTALNTSSEMTGKQEAIHMAAVYFTIVMTLVTIGAIIYFFVENWSEKR